MNADEILNPIRPLPGWTDNGVFATKAGPVRLVTNDRTGAVMQLTFNGSLRGVAPSVAALVLGAPNSDLAAYTATFSPASFDACAKLMRSEKTPVQAAVRAVLVDGMSQTAAAKEYSVFPQSVSRSVSAYRETMRLAVVAVTGG